MPLTEDEARKRECRAGGPVYRWPCPPWDQSTYDHIKDAALEWPRCSASRCVMGWRWAKVASDLPCDIEVCIKAGDKIGAIRDLRELRPLLTLKAAKEYIESIWDAVRNDTHKIKLGYCGLGGRPEE